MRRVLKGHMVRRIGDERSFGDNMNWERRQ
jgi:hypothetical protein